MEIYVVGVKNVDEGLLSFLSQELFVDFHSFPEVHWPTSPPKPGLGLPGFQRKSQDVASNGPAGCSFERWKSGEERKPLPECMNKAETMGKSWKITRKRQLMEAASESGKLTCPARAVWELQEQSENATLKERRPTNRIYSSFFENTDMQQKPRLMPPKKHQKKTPKKTTLQKSLSTSFSLNQKKTEKPSSSILLVCSARPRDAPRGHRPPGPWKSHSSSRRASALGSSERGRRVKWWLLGGGKFKKKIFWDVQKK